MRRVVGFANGPASSVEEITIVVVPCAAALRNCVINSYLKWSTETN